jgi:HicB family
MPETLHAELANAADRAGVSLNQLITSTLAESLGQGPIPARSRNGKHGTPTKSARRGGWFSVLLAANLVIVAAAGVLAILLLVSAWH